MKLFFKLKHYSILQIMINKYIPQKKDDDFREFLKRTD